MDLSTNYLGLRLKNPLMPGASPLVDNVDTVKKLEDAGAAAIVMHSLFEEQITGEQLNSIYNMEVYADSVAEAMSYFPGSREFAFGPDEYLEQIRKIKKAVSIPVIASLNGSTLGGWTEYSKQIAQAGADALELNVYHLATNAQETGAAIEQRVLDVARNVKQSISIPLAIKLSPFFSSITNLCCQLDQIGVDGIVLFNRFYQPDFDLESLEVVPNLVLSDSSELRLRLHWTALLYNRIRPDLAITGGIHTAEDVVKGVMAGARSTMMTSALLRHGIKYLEKVEEDLIEWMEVHEYESIRQMRGSMSSQSVAEPAAFERANYMKVLSSYSLKA